MNDQELIIEAGKTERHYWKDLWNYRELFYFLAWRDILVRYKQTVIGMICAALSLFLTMVGFTIQLKEQSWVKRIKVQLSRTLFSNETNE